MNKSNKPACFFSAIIAALHYLRKLWKILFVACGLLGSDLSFAENSSLHSLSMRGRFSSADLVGEAATEQFKAYDITAVYQFFWLKDPKSNIGMGTRLITSAGIMQGAGESALIVSFTPAMVLGTNDGGFTLDVGAGGALFSRHKFGTQDFGGNFEFSLTLGIAFALNKKLALGYRYQHYSDAGIYGSGKVGVDMHMLELFYRY